jgi:hypothetical protein
MNWELDLDFCSFILFASVLDIKTDQVREYSTAVHTFSTYM